MTSGMCLPLSSLFLCPEQKEQKINHNHKNNIWSTSLLRSLKEEQREHLRYD